MKNKRSQHEILGFVLIVLIVILIGVVFLSLSIMKGKKKVDTSVEISNLLTSSMYYTTECSVNYIPNYLETQDLIKKCDENPDMKCLNGKKTCESLNSTLKKLIEESLIFGADSPIKAYQLNIYSSPAALDSDSYSQDVYRYNKNNSILFLENGVFKNCTSILGGSHIIPKGYFVGGNINVELEVCKG